MRLIWDGEPKPYSAELWTKGVKSLGGFSGTGLFVFSQWGKKTVDAEKPGDCYFDMLLWRQIFGWEYFPQ